MLHIRKAIAGQIIFDEDTHKSCLQNVHLRFSIYFRRFQTRRWSSSNHHLLWSQKRPITGFLNWNPKIYSYNFWICFKDFRNILNDQRNSTFIFKWIKQLIRRWIYRFNAISMSCQSSSYVIIVWCGWTSKLMCLE